MCSFHDMFIGFAGLREHKPHQTRYDLPSSFQLENLPAIKYSTTLARTTHYTPRHAALYGKLQYLVVVVKSLFTVVRRCTSVKPKIVIFNIQHLTWSLAAPPVARRRPSSFCLPSQYRLGFSCCSLGPREVGTAIFTVSRLRAYEFLQGPEFQCAFLPKCSNRIVCASRRAYRNLSQFSLSCSTLRSRHAVERGALLLPMRADSES